MNDKVISDISNFGAEAVLVHVGYHDLASSEISAETLEVMAKQIVKKLLDRTNAKITISHIIPTNQTPPLDDKIIKYNRLIDESISETRKLNDLRMFGSINRRLTQFLTYAENRKGKAATLNNHGQMILWLMTKDAIWRSLNDKTNSRKVQNND